MKPLFVISCPIDTFSGYGARSRDIAKALIKSDKYNVKILPYGLDPLKLFCEREVFLNSVERKGKFPATYKCMNNRGDSK